MCNVKRIVEVSLDDVRSKNYEKNIENFGEHSDTCLICGKRTNGKGKMVHLLTSLNIVSYDGDDIEDSQGFFPIGNDCAKKVNNIVKFAF